MSGGAGHRRGSDPVLLWLWRRPVATAPIRPLAWEPPHAVGAALDKAKTKNKTERNQKKATTKKTTTKGKRKKKKKKKRSRDW